MKNTRHVNVRRVFDLVPVRCAAGPDACPNQHQLIEGVGRRFDGRGEERFARRFRGDVLAGRIGSFVDDS
jgi:hypothetical protein